MIILQQRVGISYMQMIVPLEIAQGIRIMGKTSSCCLCICTPSKTHTHILNACHILFQHGACVNAADLWKFTPLHEAAAKGKFEICKLLLKVQ